MFSKQGESKGHPTITAFTWAAGSPLRGSSKRAREGDGPRGLPGSRERAAVKNGKMADSWWLRGAVLASSWN